MKVFVYGTLKKEWWNNRVLGESDFLREAETEFGYNLFDAGGIPVMDHDKGQYRVKGELYEVRNPVVLGNLDALEGHPHTYRRTTIELNGGETAVAYLGSGIMFAQLKEVKPNRWGVKEYTRRRSEP